MNIKKLSRGGIFATWGENGRAETLLLEWVVIKKGLFSCSRENCSFRGKVFHIFDCQNTSAVIGKP